MNERNLRFAVIIITIFLHLAVIIFVVFETNLIIRDKIEEQRTINVTYIDIIYPELPEFQALPPSQQQPLELQPQPQIQPQPQRQEQPVLQPSLSLVLNETDTPLVEEIAEIMIEADPVPEQEIVPAGTLMIPVDGIGSVDHDISSSSYGRILGQNQVDVLPSFDEASIAAELTYPRIALREGIEGRVILDLFVDRTGKVLSVNIMLEDPQGWGFGEAAVNLFTGRVGTPAYAGGEPVICRFRRPVTFRIIR